MSEQYGISLEANKYPVVSARAKVQPLEVSVAVCTSVATDHSRLSGCDNENQHPIGAISDLAFRLDDKLEKGDVHVISNLEIDDLLR